MSSPVGIDLNNFTEEAKSPRPLHNMSEISGLKGARFFN